MNIIETRLKKIIHQIEAAAQQYHKDPASVKLLLVSKGQPLQAIQNAINAGQQVFGENYLQEALLKITALSHYTLEWHFIGAIQSNKTKGIAANFDWVESVCSYKIAKRLSEQRPASLPPLNVCIQVNINNEPTKEGVTGDEVFELAERIVKLPHLKLRGLMSIPTPTNNVTKQREAFQKCRELMLKLQISGINIDTLSMGMSNDFEAAIAEGSTQVRIGTAIFGNRK